MSLSADGEVLRVAMRHRVGGLALDVAFALRAPWTVLFGPSGSGKTTVLRAIGGLVRPDAGRMVLGERVLVDTAAGVMVRADRRGVRSAGQAARVFPGMTVRENLGFGCAEAGVVGEVMRLFRLEGFAAARPGSLSGGERQRVSVARAVASAAGSGALLLLDEPFAGMDYGLRDALAVELRDWLRARGVPVLSVTHDVGEAFLLGAEVVRLAEGRVVEQGPVARVLAGERARLLGQLGG